MKVIVCNGSPHKEGNTNSALSFVSRELEAEGIETEFIHVGGSNIRGCTGCGGCQRGNSSKCVFDNDIVNEAIAKVQAADGLLLGSPVYYGSIAGEMKCFLDRLFFAGSGYEFKVGGAVVALRRSGGIDAFHQLNNYFQLAKIIVAPSQYWNVIHGAAAGEVSQDKEGVQIMQMLGRNMAWLIKALAEGRKTFEPPVMPEKRERTNFIR